MLQIPNEPREITAAWLTAALRSSGVLGKEEVTTVDMLPLSESRGVSSQLLRLQVTYSSKATHAPRSLIVKLHSADPQMRRTIFAVPGHYARETEFFAHLADKIPVRIPRCYYSAIEPEAYASILLLEDLAPAQTLDTIQGCSPAAAELAIRQVVRLHAHWWQRPELDDLMRFSFDNPRFAQQLQQLYQQRWQPFMRVWGDRLPPAIRTIGERLAQQVAYIYERLQQPPCTLIHNDFHLGNLLFAPPGSDAPPALIDWQHFAIGRGTTDVANLLGRDMLPDERRRSEEKLLRLYCALLAEQGVADYAFDTCLVDYRLTMLKRFAVFVVAASSVNLSAALTENTFGVWVPRWVTMLLAHDAGALLPD